MFLPLGCVCVCVCVVCVWGGGALEDTAASCSFRAQVKPSKASQVGQTDTQTDGQTGWCHAAHCQAVPKQLLVHVGLRKEGNPKP
jgi:hypothetical protein